MLAASGQSDWLIVVAPPLLAVLLLPFFINVPLARSRGKSVPWVLVLTLVFSWLATLVLAVLPKTSAQATAKDTAGSPAPQG